MDKRSSQQEVWGRRLLLALILLAFVLRLYDLGRREFWFDEALSANISKLGWEGAVAHLRNEPFEHPPLYFLALYPWQKLVGTSEFSFRFFSALWGVLFIPLLYVFVRRLAGERPGLLAALLATISPFMVAYSRETRMYTLLPCLALLAVLSFWHALERNATQASGLQKGRSGWWLAYALLLAVGVATHYFFAWIWLAITLYLLLELRRRRQVITWALAVQLMVLVVSVVWWFAAPGLRSSLVRLSQGEMVFSLGYKLSKIMPTLLLADIGESTVPPVALALMAGGWLLTLLGVWWSRRAHILDPRAWRLLLLLVVIPLLGSLFIPYGVLGRHLGYTLIAVFTFMALALLDLARRGRFWLATASLLILLLSTYGLAVQFRQDNGDFRQALTYIDERGQSGDLLVIPQPDQRHLVDYYNVRSWPVRYLPNPDSSLTAAQVDDALRDIVQLRSRLWLGPVGAWTADPEHLVEQWLAANTFQAEKAWFPASSSVALYFTDDDGVVPVKTDPIIWGGRIRLRGLQASSLQALPGGAIRLRFDWRAKFDVSERCAVSLSLVDDEGLVWAERRSEPCSGWCPTDTWAAGRRVRDQHALLIPPGTPPGTYHLQVAWISVVSGSVLPAEGSNGSGAYAAIAEVTVLPSPVVLRQPGTLPNPLQATFGGQITLLGYELASVEARPGGTLHLETYWRADSRPAGDYTLVVELTDRRGHPVASWQAPPSASFYPTSAWQPGEYVRGQCDLLVPQPLSPGRYRLQLALLSPTGERLALRGERRRQAVAGLLPWRERLEGQELPLTDVHLIDRPRQFQLPLVSHPLKATVGKRAHLVGYDLDLSRAYPGGQLSLTLYWQAGGPLVRSFKVFTHLVDAQGKKRAQHDALPGGGCCPTNTWVAGEVIVDQHLIPLDADLPPGSYQLVVGMYDVQPMTRLPAYDAAGKPLPSDRIPISSVIIASVQQPGQPLPARVEPPFEVHHAVFLPLIGRDE